MGKIWDAAHILRGQMDTAEYKNVILPLAFYKILSDRTEKKVQEILYGRDIHYKDAWNDHELKGVLTDSLLEENGYLIEPDDLYTSVAALAQEFRMDCTRLRNIYDKIEKSAEGRKMELFFDDLFQCPDIDDRRLCEFILVFFEDACYSDIDTLGENYMELIEMFAVSSGKKNGEYYTPRCLCKLTAGILNCYYSSIESLSDPACGSGALLMEVCRQIAVGFIHGRDTNPSAYRLIRMNALAHGWKNSMVFECGDTLLDESREIYQVQVANPPFSLRWNPIKSKKYPITAPRRFADYAFVQHIVYHMGEMAVVILPVGTLYRNGTEREIRFSLLKQNLVDTVIRLPGGLFSGTAVPVCIMILKRNRLDHSILFVDASEECVRKRGSCDMEESNIKRILHCIKARREERGFARVVEISELKDGNFMAFPHKQDKNEEYTMEQLAEMIVQKQKNILKMQEMIFNGVS